MKPRLTVDVQPGVARGLVLAVLVVSALMFRIWYLHETDMIKPLRADALQYAQYGYNLAFHSTFSRSDPAGELVPDSFRSPGYPLLIAAVFRVVGEADWYRAVLYLQAAIGALLVLATYWVGHLFLARWAAFVSAVLVALSPHLVSIGSYVLTEALFAFVLTVGLGVFFVAVRSRQTGLFVLAGFVFGYAYLVNQAFLFLPFLLAGAVWAGGRGRSAASGTERGAPVRGVVAMLAVFLLFASGWALRGRLSVSADSPDASTRALSALTHGTYPGFVYETEAYKYFPYREDPAQPAYSQSLGEFFPIFWARFKQRPWRYASWYLFEKPYYLWSWDILQGQGDVYIYTVSRSLYHRSRLANITRVLMKVLHPLLLLLALTGVAVQVGRARTRGAMIVGEPLFLALTLAYFTCLYSILTPWPRYAIPLRPLLYLAATWTMVTVVDGWQARRSGAERQPVAS